MSDLVDKIKEVLSINWFFSFPDSESSDEERIGEIIDELEEMGVWK